MAQNADIFVACLRTDDQMEAVAEELAAHGRPGQLIVVAGTHSLDFMRRLAGIVEAQGLAAHRCARRVRRSWVHERETCSRCVAVKPPTSNGRDR